MALRLNVLTQPESVEAALTDPTQPNAFYRLPELIINDTLNLELFFMDGGVGIEPWSGDINYEVRVGIGELGGLPAGGTFVLKDDLDETMELDLSAPAQDVEDVLNGLNTGTGPFGGMVDITKVATGIYTLKRRELGAFPVIEGDGTLLSPDSTVVIDEVFAGSPTQAQVLSIRLVRQPYAFNDVWDAIVDDSTGVTVGFSGSLSLNTLRMMQFLAGKASAKAWLEIEVTDPFGNVITHAQEKVTIRNEVIGNAVSDPANFPSEAVKYFQNKFAISSLTGGGATALDGLATFNRGLGTLVGAEVELGKVSLYRLESGTDAESIPDIVRPLDFDETDNPKVWKRKRVDYLDWSNWEMRYDGVGQLDILHNARYDSGNYYALVDGYAHMVQFSVNGFEWYLGQGNGGSMPLAGQQVFWSRGLMNAGIIMSEDRRVTRVHTSGAPEASYDRDSGYRVGDVMIYGGGYYTCIDDTPDAAVWIITPNPHTRTLTDGGGSQFDTYANSGSVFTFTLDGDKTLTNPQNLWDGQTLVWIIKQDATGGHTLTFGSAFKFAGGTLPTLSTDPNAVDILTGISDGSNVYVSLQKNFS